MPTFILPASTPPMAQVTSVSQLTDIQPTDWAFQALQGLVERYGCISGYPDRTFRGNRALTRSEFAAGLSACLDHVNEQIKSRQHRNGNGNPRKTAVFNYDETDRAGHICRERGGI
jgi:S-layer homology domain